MAYTADRTGQRHRQAAGFLLKRLITGALIMPWFNHHAAAGDR